MDTLATVTRADRPIRLNISHDLDRDFSDILSELNCDFDRQPGRPRVEIATTASALNAAAALLATTFASSRDRSWIAWLPPREIAQIMSGDFAAAARKLAPIIGYLLSAALTDGGIVAYETADDEGSGTRIMRGAALRKLPSATPEKESMLRRYLVGAGLAVRSYGVRRALAADRAARALEQATEAMIVQHGIPDRCVRGGMIAVLPSYRGLGVSSRMSAPFHELADRNGLWSVLQSSSPEYNDDRVFYKWGFSLIGRHRYGPSSCNGIGPYELNILARRPKVHKG